MAPRKTPAVYTDATADLSADHVYRYNLGRRWDERLPQCLFVMLNPSTADALVDDPTVRRCVGFARAWGHGGVMVVNLFALRATDPTTLYGHPDPIGPMNDEFIQAAAARCDAVVAAWGAHGGLHERGAAVAAMLASQGIRLRCLGVTAERHPRHPLYLRSDSPLIDFPVPEVPPCVVTS